MTLADALAAARAAAVLPIAYALAFDQRGTAFAVFVVAALSDAVDGWVARRRPPSSHGALIDPLADKTLVVGTAIALWFSGLEQGLVVPPELLALLVVRELTAATIRVAHLRAGSPRPADLVGKLKTAAEMVALATLIVERPPAPLAGAAVTVLWIAVLIGFATLPALLRPHGGSTPTA